MGWSPVESLIESRRSQIRQSPRTALKDLRFDLQQPYGPRDRIRLLGLICAAHRQLGQWDDAETALNEASANPCRSKTVQAELAGQRATLRLAQALNGVISWDVAAADSRRFLALAETLPIRHPTTTEWGARQKRYRQRILVTAIVLRGQVHLHGYGEISRALRCAREALQALPKPPASGPTPRITFECPRAPLSLLATAIVRGASGPDVHYAAPIIEDLLSALPEEEVLLDATFRAVQACILARLGEAELAEGVFLHSLEALHSIGAKNAYNQVLTMLDWCVREVRSQPERAAFLRESLALQDLRTVLPLSAE